MKCRKVLGFKICKFGNGSAAATIPNGIQIPFTIYTAPDCGNLCNRVVNDITKHVVKPLGDSLNVKTIDISKPENAHYMQQSLLLPFFSVGSQRLGSYPQEQDVLFAVREELKRTP